MVRIAAFIGLIAAVGLGFILLNNSHSAEGPGAGGGAANVAGATGGVPRAGAGPPVTAVPVLPARVERRGIQQILEVSGSLKTDDDVEVGSRIEGRVSRVLVREGNRVSAGQLLVQLDGQELQAQISRARAVVASAQARLSLAGNQATWKDATARADFERAEGMVSTARSRLQQAETNQKLIETQTRIAVETAQSGVRVATERLSIARDLTRKQELRQAQLVVEQAQAELSRARVDVSNAKQSLERRQNLFRQDAIAKEEVDEAERRHVGLQAQERVAAAAVSAAQQKLDLAREGSRPEEVRIAEGQLAAAQRNLVQATSDEQRRQVAADEVEAARSAVRQAEAAVAGARAGLVQPRISQDEVAAAGATLLQAKADVQFFQTQIRDLEIRAPVGGVIATRWVNGGEMVTKTTRLMQLVALDKVYLEASVPELDAGMLRPGLTADMSVDARPGLRLSGVVREVIPVADRGSRAFRARISPQGRRGDLPPGGFARARILVGTRRETLSIRKDAINSESGDKFVWLIESGDGGKLTARRRQVRLGLVDDVYAEILDGLKAGEQVVAAGSPTIVDGSAVEVAKK